MPPFDFRDAPRRDAQRVIEDNIRQHQQRFLQDIDIPGLDPVQEKMRMIDQDILRGLRDGPAPLHKPRTPAEWKQSYLKGYAT